MKQKMLHDSIRKKQKELHDPIKKKHKELHDPMLCAVASGNIDFDKQIDPRLIRLNRSQLNRSQLNRTQLNRTQLKGVTPNMKMKHEIKEKIKD